MKEKSHRKSAFLSVFKRELRRIVQRPLYFGVCVLLPLFSLFFMATIFHTGQMENIPIGVVDLDETASSRSVLRNISATPTFNVVRHFSNPHLARQSVQRKEIYGYAVIPYRFESDLMAGNAPTITYYYHYALLSVGGEVLSGFARVLTPVSMVPILNTATQLGVDENQIKPFLLPINPISQPLYNPALNYSVYLSVPFFFVFLQIIVLLTTVYTFGIEFKKHTADEWVQTANGNILVAALGKMLPYTLIYIKMALLANYVLFVWVGIPQECGFLSLNIYAILFIIATQAFGLFVFSLYPVLGLVISVVSMIGSLGATLCGVTFPIPDMYEPIQWLSHLFPIRHFMEIMQNLLYGNYGFPYMWQSVAALFVYPVLAMLLLPRLKRWILRSSYGIKYT